MYINILAGAQVLAVEPGLVAIVEGASRAGNADSREGEPVTEGVAEGARGEGGEGGKTKDHTAFTRAWASSS